MTLNVKVLYEYRFCICCFEASKLKLVWPYNWHTNCTKKYTFWSQWIFSSCSILLIIWVNLLPEFSYLGWAKSDGKYTYNGVMRVTHFRLIRTWHLCILPLQLMNQFHHDISLCTIRHKPLAWLPSYTLFRNSSNPCSCYSRHWHTSVSHKYLFYLFVFSLTCLPQASNHFRNCENARLIFTLNMHANEVYCQSMCVKWNTKCVNALGGIIVDWFHSWVKRCKSNDEIINVEKPIVINQMGRGCSDG